MQELYAAFSIGNREESGADIVRPTVSGLFSRKGRISSAAASRCSRLSRSRRGGIMHWIVEADRSDSFAHSYATTDVFGLLYVSGPLADRK